jgi:predicted nucleotide-binding protein
VQDNLEHDVSAAVWTQGIFRLSRTPIDSLIEALTLSDFAVFVVAPNDKLVSRDVEYSSARDNVVFEMGLFVGRLGLRRTFLIAPRGIDLHLPSDLEGVAQATYQPERVLDNPVSALGAATNQIRRAIRDLGAIER